MIELITGLITNQDSQVLLAKSSNNGWWELPGTRFDADPWVEPEDTLSRALLAKLGLGVPARDSALPHLTTVSVVAGGVDFSADVRRVGVYNSFPMETETSGYSDIAWVNLLRRKIGQIGLSPITEGFVKYCQDEPRRLRIAD